MRRLTPQQRLQIVQICFENHGSVRNTYRALRPFYSSHDRPSEQLIALTMKRFRKTLTLLDNKHPQRRNTVRTEEVIAAVERSVEKDPNQSIRHRARQLNMCPSTLWKILRKDHGENQKDIGCQKNMIKKEELGTDDNLTVEQRKQIDADVTKEKEIAAAKK